MGASPWLGRRSSMSPQAKLPSRVHSQCRHMFPGRSVCVPLYAPRGCPECCRGGTRQLPSWNLYWAGTGRSEHYWAGFGVQGEPTLADIKSGPKGNKCKQPPHFGPCHCLPHDTLPSILEPLKSLSSQRRTSGHWPMSPPKDLLW